jgi:hypothetical protein
LQVTSADGGTTLRYNVTSAAPGQATAILDGNGNMSMIRAGNIATVIEADSPEAKGRRLNRVDLP